MTSSQVIEVESLQVVHLEPGDCLLLKFTGHLSESAMRNIKEMILKALPQLGDLNKVIVLDESAEAVGVIRTEKAG